MNKLRILSLLMMFILINIGCGDDNGDKEKIDIPEQINPDIVKEVSGGLSEYYNASKAVIKITTQEILDEIEADEMILNIELIRNDKEFDFDKDNIGLLSLSGWGTYSYAFNISVDLLDKDGIPVKSNYDTMNEYDQLKTLIKLKPNESQRLQYDLNYNWALSLEEVLKIKSVKVNSELVDVSKIEDKESDYQTGDYENDEKYISSNGNEDWDEIIDDYEDYINLYIKLYKKAQDGDDAAMSEYIEAMDKANNLAKKMENAGNELTIEQSTRFVKLQLKLANAAAELMN